MTSSERRTENDESQVPGSRFQDSEPGTRSSPLSALVPRHLAIGWWGLLVFLSLGIVLEGFHGFKVRWYLDFPENDVRRLMWTLAHAHGTLLSVLHIAFAGTLRLNPAAPVRRMRPASRFLTAALILLPGGFLLGGIIIHEGDPGLGILLVPIGAAFLFGAVLLTALAQRTGLGERRSESSEQAPGSDE